jgi:hypothetical protein
MRFPPQTPVRGFAQDFRILLTKRPYGPDGKPILTDKALSEGVRVWRRTSPKRKIGLMAFVGALIGYSVWGPSLDVLPIKNPAAVSLADTVLEAFEKGYVPEHFTPNDVRATVSRDRLHKELLDILRPRNSHEYYIVVGAHGTGKVGKEWSGQHGWGVGGPGIIPSSLSPSSLAVHCCPQSSAGRPTDWAQWRDLHQGE